MLGRDGTVAVDLAFTTWGERNSKTLLLIHGIAGCGRIWEPIAYSLAEGFRVLAPDLRGHGASPWANSYTPEEYLTDIDSFVARRELGPVVLIGHAIGGLLCAGYAIRHPQQARALVCIDINLPPPGWQIDRIRAIGSEPWPVFPSRGAAVAFFASADADYVTGQVLSVSGGLTMVG